MNLATTDQIFKSWRVARDEIADDPTKEHPVYCSDVCMSKSLTSTNFFTQRECCYGCNTLKTLMTSYYLDKEREIKVASGSKKGTVLKIFSRENIDTSVSEGGISLNPFMNYVVVSCILKRILSLKSYPVDIPYEWSYVCKDRFNIVLDVTNASSIKDISRLNHLTNSSPLARKTACNPISKTTTGAIFKQIALLCHFYGMYQFSHGEPSITYICLTPVSTRFKYNGKEIKSSVKVSLSPSVYSSVVYEGTRIAYRRHTHRHLKTYENKDVGIEGEEYSGSYDNHRVVYVKIGNKSEQFLKNIINGYCDLKGFDFVMFVASLMSNQQFMASFKDCPYIDIWKSIWRKEDYDKLMTDLSVIRTNSFRNVFNVLKQYYFRVDALDYTISKI